MSVLIKISGDIEDIFDSIDYYQTIALSDKSASDLRKKYIDSLLDEYNFDIKNISLSNKNAVVHKNNEAVASIEYVSNGIILDDVLVRKSDEVDSEHGVFLEDLSVSDINKVPVGKVEYAPNGIYLDEMDGGVSDNIESFEGSYIDDSDDYVESSYSDVGGDEDVFDFEEESSGFDFGEESSDSEFDESDVNNEDADNSDESGFKKLKMVDLSDDFDVDDDVFDGLDSEESDEDTYGEYDESDIPIKPFSNSDVINESILKSPGEVSEGYSSNVPQEVTTNVVNEYKNVRDFVKRNPGCTKEEIKGYFSARDIQKALMASKIVEKRKKYYVV